jgi:hypothetical protein
MRVLTAAVVCLGLALNASAEVSVQVYRCDGTTALSLKDPNIPDIFSDIMVGTHLVLVVSSDAPVLGEDWWWGALLTTLDDWDRGKLIGRGFNPATQNYESSCLEAAGWSSFVTPVESPDLDRIGFNLSADSGPVAGDWFVLDYRAEKVGSCDARLFEYTVVGNEPVKGDPRDDDAAKPLVETIVETLTLTQVPSCDLNSDHIVNFRDFALLTSHWRQVAGPDPAAPALPDLDADGLIGPSDISQFTDFWLERTDCSEIVAEP